MTKPKTRRVRVTLDIETTLTLAQIRSMHHIAIAATPRFMTGGPIYSFNTPERNLSNTWGQNIILRVTATAAKKGRRK